MSAAPLPDDGLARLRAVMARLRDPDSGCPWDLEQSLASLQPYLVEECYEAVDAIAALGPAAQATTAPAPETDPARIAEHCEELGDVLLQVVFQSQLASEFGWFGLDDVARGIANKMVRRHPHVFPPADSTTRASEAGAQPAPPTPDAVMNQWARIKAEERRAKGDPDRSVLSGVPRSLPALLRAQRIGARAARVGFDWSSVDGALAKVDEELAELREALAAGDADAITHEVGDLLFAATSAARHAGVDAEQSLRVTLDRFSARFAGVERRLAAHSGPAPDEATLERWWQDAKRALAAEGTGAAS